MRASSPLVVLLMVALAALAKASVFGGRKRRGTPGGSAFCYTTPLNRGFFHRPYILRPSGLYKSNDDDASTFSVPDASPTPQSSSPSLSPSSSSSSSTAIFPYVRVEEAAHPLLHRSLPRSFAFFLQRARAIFFPSPCTPSSSPSSRLTPATSPPPAIWPRLREICRPEYPLLTLSTLTLLLAASVEVAVPHFSSQALSAILQQKGQTEFFRAVQRVFELGVLAALSTGVRGLCFGLAGTRIVCRLRHALFKSLLQQDIAFFDRTKSGELTNRLTADCVKISNVVSLNVNILLRQAIQLLGGLLYLHRLHARIALLTAGGMAVIFLVTGAHGRYNRKMAEEIQDTLASSNAVAGTSLSLIRLVRTHVGESTELERYDQALRKTLNNMEAHDFGYGAYRLAVRLAQTGLLTAVLTVGWQLTCSGAMSMDQLTSALFYVQFVMNASFDVSDQYSRIQEALGSATQVFALLDRTPAMSVKPLSPSPSLPTSAPSSRATSSPPSSSERHGASVVFSNVSFTYPLRPHTPILSSLYLNIGPGQRVAVVGASGGGKSTLLRLLARHYDVDAGSIFLDGRDLLTFSQEELSHKVAMLSQEPPLLPISIKDNIAYGLKPGTFSQADVEAAARAANIYDFIQSLPDRFETVIGEGSVGLSGGEKQRVAIARALMRKPEVLLLDEPSSALDQSSQAIVQAALERAAEGRTTLIIAHRLSTIESCDSIIVLKSGAVVERGTHAELLAKEGVYAAFRAQQTFMQPPKDVEPRRAQAVKEPERI